VIGVLAFFAGIGIGAVLLAAIFASALAIANARPSYLPRHSK